MGRRIASALLLVLPLVAVPGVAVADPIIGGTTTTTTAFPTVVDLETQPGEFFCTGTLVDASYILTAAHCLEAQGVGTVNVRFGDTDITQGTGGTVIAATELVVHPSYTQGALANDIALVKLATPSAVTPTRVDRNVIPAGTSVVQVGYGDNDEQGDGGGVLRTLTSLTAACANAGDPAISSANLLCFDAAVRGNCFGDSGGPAFVGGAVAGVTSGGTLQTCTGSGGWDLYTAVAANLDFVDAVLAPGQAGSGSSGASGSGGAQGTGGGGGGIDSPGIPQDDGGGCAVGGGPSALIAALQIGTFLSRRRRLQRA